MWDFSKLLGSLAGEDSKGFLGGVIDPNARKRTPPKTELTPSENAAGELMTGVHEAAQAPTKPAISPLRQGLASGLKGVGTALGGMHSAEFMPVAPVQIYDQPIIQPYQAPQIPRFARGGKLKDGLNIVGENGPEVAVKDGEDTKIVPLSQNDVEDAAYWDAQVAMQKAGQATPPFVSTPGYEAAKRRAFDAETGNQPITTDASVSSNITNRPMDYVPVSPSDVQQGRVGTQPVVVQPQYSTPPTAQQEMPIVQAPAPTSNPNAGSGNPLEDLRQQKIDLNAQPIQKQSFWKDFGTNLILGANAFFNPQNGPSPMVGWGAVKRQNENNALDRQIKPLEAIQGQREASNYKQAQSQKLYADTVKQLADANHQRIADNLAGKKWDWHEISGRIFKKYADGKVEPWIDPETGKPGINKTGVPIERLLADGTKVSVTGPQALTADAAMQEANARREQEANLYNDRSQQDVDKWNAENKLKVDLANQKAIADWQSNRFQRAVDIIKSNADAFAKSGEAQGLAEQAQTLAQQAQDLSGRIAEEVDPEEQAKLLKQFNDLTKQMGTLQGKFGAVAGEFGKTQELANLYKQSDVQKPKPVGFTPRQFKGGVQPVTRGGKVAQSSDVDAFAQSKGWTRVQAEQYLKNNGYKIQ